MNQFLQRAFELKEKMVQDRRNIHRNAECGMTLPFTSAYVQARLEEMGYKTEPVGRSGLMAVAGKRGPVILLRADMDALPMGEESGLEFSSITSSAHCCGHDLHTSMLLAAAQMLKEREGELAGTVKFMFQPGEEVGTGAKEMVEQGILDSPVPNAVLGMHVNAKSPLYQLNYGKGYTFCSNDNLTIRVTGRGGHGARPQEAIDPVKVGCHVYMALQSIKANSVSPLKPVILTITAMNGGSGYNLIPDTMELKGTLRTYDNETREDVMIQIREKAETVARAFGAEAEVSFGESVPPVVCAEAFTDEILEYASEIVGKERIAAQGEVKMGSEDFSFITEKYPDSCGYLFIGAGPNEEEGFPYGQHNSKVVFNEDVMPYGAAVMANSAMRWLAAQSNEEME